MTGKIVGTIAICSFLALGLSNFADPTYENLDAVLWMQTSVEYKANSMQTYRLAEIQLIQALHDPHWTAALEQAGAFGSLPPAVILDLDETVLDNSRFQAYLTLHPDVKFDTAWPAWMSEHSAGIVPGAMDFLKFARANGVTPLYITNRHCDASNPDDSTVRQLRELNLPLDSAPGILQCYDTGLDKSHRRSLSASKFRILLLFGDQLGDFLSTDPDRPDLEELNRLYDSHKSLWGERWFQLSNPMYGSWLDALGKDKLRHLRTWPGPKSKPAP